MRGNTLDFGVNDPISSIYNYLFIKNSRKFGYCSDNPKSTYKLKY